jgi:GMP synthase-like glutamine amidotransferase
MRVHVFQHVSFEGLGSIGAWLKEVGADVTYTRFYESATLPKNEDVDFLVVMGGPMSVNDEKEFPWLQEEKRFIKEVISSEKPVLGICLGAQLMASSLGALVYSGAHKEIGWFPVYYCHNGPDLFRFPKKIDVFHWHGETFDLPAGAVHLAKSDGCLHQAFQIGPCAVGLQFHLETTPDIVESMIANCGHELAVNKFVQNEDQLRSMADDCCRGINMLMHQLLNAMTNKSIPYFSS